jgi:hypothetical protein
MMNILMVQFLLLLLLAGYLHAGKFIPVNPQQLPSSDTVNNNTESAPLSGPAAGLLAALNLSEADRARILARIRDRTLQLRPGRGHKRPKEAPPPATSEPAIDEKEVDSQWSEFARWRKKRRRRRKLRKQILRDVLRELGIVLTKQQKGTQDP